MRINENGPSLFKVITSMMWLLLLFISLAYGSEYDNHTSYLSCDFEQECEWQWNKTVLNGFEVSTGEDVQNEFRLRPGEYNGPFVDSNNNSKGHFLFLEMKPETKELHVWSPKYSNTLNRCRLQIYLNMVNMSTGNFKVVVETVNKTSWLVEEKLGNNKNMWEKHVFSIGRIKQEFRIILEVTPSQKFPAHLSMDNIQIIDCFPVITDYVKCSNDTFRCADEDEYCINKTKVCDIEENCWNGADEKQGCEKVPAFARCNFEDGNCGWTNARGTAIQWQRGNGSKPFKRSYDVRIDHTYQNTSGTFLYVNMSTSSTKLGAAALLESPLINPPPNYHGNPNSSFFKSCYIRFFYHQPGSSGGSLSFFLIEKDSQPERLFYVFGDTGENWQRQVVELPTNITQRYKLQFEARKGLQARSDVAVDDFTMSPECFGLNVPEDVKGSYDFDTYSGHVEPTPPVHGHTDFTNATSYIFTSCGSTGRFGPTEEQCTKSYNDSNVSVRILTDATLEGHQKWTVPESGYYTIIAKGAGGGKGSGGNKGLTKGAIATTVVELYKNQSLFIIVGQEGSNACIKSFAASQHNSCYTLALKKPHANKINALKELKNMELLDGGGGGGGASYVYLWSTTKGRLPIVVAAGGGGIAPIPSEENTYQHGQDANHTNLGITGIEEGRSPAGAGGGWSAVNSTREITGGSFLQGSVGGKACAETKDHRGSGGFGGGGGGCNSGGGGGGFVGGNVTSSSTANGHGGYSYVLHNVKVRQAVAGANSGQGSVIIIPVIEGCGCNYRCAALDEYAQSVICLCPDGWLLGKDNQTCFIVEHRNDPFFMTAIGIAVVFLLCVGLTCTCYYNNYQKKKEKRLKMKMMNGADLQLSRLRAASDNMMTEYNPNYEFGGGTYTLKDLKEIPRENLRLVKPLGQGAFGEVYQGFYKHRAGDAVEMPVAVKTLPELSTSQAEMDFLMEALIMMKFNHPNIVHFIGVCFDKHPRFIILELLVGGDLKTFLRESRPKPDRSSPLTMKDLLQCAIDVAKGCAYLEEHRFIHRDIAARNCLLTTKGPGRTVKIADFGMARDIYRADYYRKGGRAMLPIKWMPPEAFLDGIFTSKTDVWSFGVLLWEIMSLGYMPYTGCANRQVMQLVTSGGRLEPPSNCPPQIYAVMTKCWHPKPDERPSFILILERLGYCLQDPEVVNAPLPVFYRPPSTERDMTIVRPLVKDDDFLNVQRSSDYLVPNENSASCSSMDQIGTQPPDCWDKTFPESLSSQPLMSQENVPDLLNIDPMNITTKNTRRPLKSALSLDPSALSIPYVNVKVPPSITNNLSDSQDQTMPFTVESATTRRLTTEA